MSEYLHKFQTNQQLSLGVFTWNCAGNLPSQIFDVGNMILPKDASKQPDIYIIGL